MRSQRSIELENSAAFYSFLQPPRAEHGNNYSGSWIFEFDVPRGRAYAFREAEFDQYETELRESFQRMVDWTVAEEQLHSSDRIQVVLIDRTDQNEERVLSIPLTPVGEFNAEDLTQWVASILQLQMTRS